MKRTALDQEKHQGSRIDDVWKAAEIKMGERSSAQAKQDAHRLRGITRNQIAAHCTILDCFFFFFEQETF